jgi:hypothetical protein
VKQKSHQFLMAFEFFLSDFKDGSDLVRQKCCQTSGEASFNNREHFYLL